MPLNSRRNQTTVNTHRALKIWLHNVENNSKKEIRKVKVIEVLGTWEQRVDSGVTAPLLANSWKMCTRPRAASAEGSGLFALLWAALLWLSPGSREGSWQGGKLEAVWETGYNTPCACSKQEAGRKKESKNKIKQQQQHRVCFFHHKVQIWCQ